MANNALNINVCETCDELKTKLKKFKRRKEKNTAALILKINTNSKTIILDEELEDVTLDEIAAELPTHEPRYIYYSYVQKHDDGRVSYPQTLVFVSPEGCSPLVQMMYVGSVDQIKRDSETTKFWQVREPEELTEELLLEKLAK